MEITFASRQIEKLCSSEKVMNAKLGDRNARLLQQRLFELQAAETLEDLRNLPGARCHELKGSRHGQLAVDLVHPKRLIFQADHDPVPIKPDGGLNWQGVTRVRILETVDYH